MTMKLGLQLYSLREQLAEDFDGVIPLVAAMKYAGVEPWGDLPVPMEHAARAFQRYGLEVPSSHLPLLTGPDKNRWLDAAGTLGLKTIVLPSLPESDFADAEGLKRAAEMLTASAEAAHAAGYAYGYHNHWWEWTPIDGQPALYRLAEMLDPSIVFEIDLYWAQVAGQDPAAVLRHFGARVPLVHLKDGPADHQASPMVALGDGTVDFEPIVGASAATWGIVELDRCETDMLEAVGRSSGYLRGRGWAAGRQ